MIYPQPCVISFASYSHSRSENGVSFCPAESQSVPYDGVRESSSVSPVADAQRVVSDCDDSVGRDISLLLRSCGPATVSRLVAGVVVYTVNSLSSWASPHVHQERFIGLPSFTHCNPSSAVSMVVAGLGHVASMHHANPAAILPRVGLSSSSFQNVHRQAAATLSVTVRERTRNNSGFVAAITQTSPMVSLVFGFCNRYRNKSSESMTGKLKSAHGDSNYPTYVVGAS